MRGRITIDTLYLHMKYPFRDIYDRFYQQVASVDSRILKNGFVMDDYLIKNGSSGYKLSIWQHDARVFLTDQVDEKCGEGKGMGIWIQLGPKFLLDNITNLHKEVYRFLFYLGVEEAYPLSVSRIDLAIDFLGMAMIDQNVNDWMEGWVGRSKLSKVIYNSRTGVLESLYVGSRKSPIYLRIYDKVAQAKEEGDYQYWLDVWKGFDGPVTRIEWEVKPKDGNFSETITTFHKFGKTEVVTLMNYLMDWGRLCIPNSSDSNRNRWEEHELWKMIRRLIKKWQNGIDWPTSRYGKEFQGVSERYVKFLSGTLSGGMAKLNPHNPSLMGLLEGLEGAGEDIKKIQHIAKLKAEVVKRS